MKHKFDLDGNPIIPIPKCKLCGKEKGRHQANSFHCPVGMRFMSNNNFSRTDVYTPRKK